MLLVRSWRIPALLLSLELVFGQNENRAIFSKTYPSENRRHLHIGTQYPQFGKNTSSKQQSISEPTSCPVTLMKCTTNVVLNFSNTGLKRIGDNFIDSPDTKELYLDNNDITEISSAAFHSMKKLEILSLSGNNISIGKLLWFQQHDTLQKLVLDDNKYNGRDTSIEKIFESLRRLEWLSLRRNRISQVNVILNDFSPRLTRLDLSGNNIMSTDFIANLPKTLSYLNLDDNAISTMNKKALDNIIDLSVSGNKLEELCDTNCVNSWLSLDGMTKLSTLNVSRNRIKSVAKDTFAKTNGLVTLDLSRNEISNLPDGIFDGPFSMVKLQMSHNQFTSVPNVYSLHRLEHLDLANNYILNIDENAFSNLHSLRSLDLSNNAIYKLPVKLISTARNLQVLLLKNNMIIDINELFTVSSNNLEKLHLQDNPLPSITVGYMPNLTIYVKELKPSGKVKDTVSTTETKKKDSDEDN